MCAATESTAASGMKQNSIPIKIQKRRRARSRHPHQHNNGFAPLCRARSRHQHRSRHQQHQFDSHMWFSQGHNMPSEHRRQQQAAWRLCHGSSRRESGGARTTPGSSRSLAGTSSGVEMTKGGTSGIPEVIGRVDFFLLQVLSSQPAATHRGGGTRFREILDFVLCSLPDVHGRNLFGKKMVFADRCPGQSGQSCICVFTESCFGQSFGERRVFYS